MIDKDFKERKLLRTHFPNARILLCHYHVIKYFAKKINTLVRGTKDEKDGILDILRALVYAKSREFYDALKLLLACKLAEFMTDEDIEEVPDEIDVLDDNEDEDEDDDEDLYKVDEIKTDALALEALQQARDSARGREHVFFKYFLKNWETCVDEWVMFERQNVAHLGNNTNNRIEAKFGQSKRVLAANMDMEETVRTILAMQEVCEDQYLKELVSVGTRIVYSDDLELNQLMNVVSDYAFELVKREYNLVKNGTVHYNIREDGTNAIVKSSAVSKMSETIEHTVLLAEYRCSCLFAQVRLLPCRHVLFYRTFKSYESVIPFKFIHPRWSLRNPINNISEGEIRHGGYMVRRAPEFRIPEPKRLEGARKRMLAAKTAARMVEIREHANRLDASRHRNPVQLSLADVEAVIENDRAFCYDTTISVVADLPVLVTKTESVVVQFREEYAPLATSTIRFVLQQEVLFEVARQLNELMPDAEDGEIGSHVVRVGDGNGFITYSQVATMTRFWLAFDAVYDVIVAVEWLRRQKWEALELAPPLNNMGEPSANLAASVALAVRAMPLGFVKTRIASTEGWKLLRFYSSEWLDTTCIVAGLECLQGGYDNVGVITPEIAQMEDEESRTALAGAHSAQAEDTEFIIRIVNTSKQAGQHWVAFFIDHTANSCVVYDPLHSAANIASVEKLVASTIAPLLDVKLKFRAHVGMAQKDGHNCGVLCLLFLELTLADGEWLPAYRSQMPFFRMRYMKMTYALMRAHGDDEEV